MKNKHVAVIGAGITGLTAADELAGLGVSVSIFERTPFAGGHGIQLNCKATDACVKCGACLVESRLQRVVHRPSVSIYTGTEIDKVAGNGPVEIFYRSHSPVVNADRCNGCGICFKKCPVPGAILQGHAPRVGPYVALRRDLCRFYEDGSCTLCRDACPQNAIELSSQSRSGKVKADAVLLATGFMPFDPSDKPYGYGCFDNVITSLDAERLLRNDPVLKRPSDGRIAEQIAFIQCVGSRDAKLKHPWCSKICCASSLRMARLIQSRCAEAQITFFYIDVQTFGKDFDRFYRQVRENVELVRAIPGDILKTAKGELEVVIFDPETKRSEKRLFDIVVLSVGLMPPGGNARIAQMFSCHVNADGFLAARDMASDNEIPFIFTAGAATGPKTIAECVSSAEKSAFDIAGYLGL